MGIVDRPFATNSLQKKVMLLVSATLLICLSGAGLYAIEGRRQLLEDQMAKRTRSLLAGLVVTAREAMLTERPDALQLLARKLAQEDREVLRIQVLHRDGAVVVSEPRRYKHRAEVESQTFVEELRAGGYSLGSVELLVRRQGFRSAVDRSTQFLLLTLLDIILLVGFVVHMAVKIYVTRPLEQVLAATEQVTQGDFQRRLELQRDDEIGVLASSFDQMAESLESYRHEVDATQRDLESRVEDRTAELRQAQARTAAILENLPLTVLMVDAERNVITANPAAKDLTGGTPESLEGASCAALLDTPFCRQDCLLFRTQTGSDHLEETHLGKSGIPVQLECSPLAEGGLVTVRDMSRLAVMRDQVRRSDRLSSIGTLAAGLAHELNNPLGNVSTYVQLLDESQGDPDRQSRLVGTIRSETDRAATIVGRLLSFARAGPSERQVVDLREVVEQAQELLLPVLAQRSVTLAPAILPESPVRVSADRGQLHQVLVNLVLNGAHAAGDGGQVTLEVSPEAGEEWPAFVVRDNGPGVESEVAERLFDPFFTTKQAGEGTGLGLSVCYGIVRDHDGTIQLKNHPEGGAEARVALPPLGRGPAA